MTTPPAMPHTRPMTRTLAALALLASVLLGAPAQADSTTPAVDYPLARVGDTVDVEVMLQAPLKSWGIRRAAKLYDREVDGLTIYTRGTCASQPQAICVRTQIGVYSDEQMLAITYGATPEWHGASEIPNTGPTAPRTIFLNARFGRSNGVAGTRPGHDEAPRLP